MVNFKIIFQRKIFEYLDYLDIFKLKYINRKSYDEIKKRELDITLDLRNTKIKSKYFII